MIGRRNKAPVVAQQTVVDAHTRYLAEPHGQANAGAIDRLYGLALAGSNGMVRIGMPTAVGSVGRYSGDLGPLQNFGRGRFAGATPSLQGSLNNSQAPGNPTLSTHANPVLAAIVTNQAGL